MDDAELRGRGGRPRLVDAAPGPGAAPPSPRGQAAPGGFRLDLGPLVLGLLEREVLDREVLDGHVVDREVVDRRGVAWASRGQGKSWTGKSWTGNGWTGTSWTGKLWTGKSGAEGDLAAEDTSVCAPGCRRPDGAGGVGALQALVLVRPAPWSSRWRPPCSRSRRARGRCAAARRVPRRRDLGRARADGRETVALHPQRTLFRCRGRSSSVAAVIGPRIAGAAPVLATRSRNRSGEARVQPGRSWLEARTAVSSQLSWV